MQELLLPERQRLNAENARLRAALEAVEWVALGDMGIICLWCFQWKYQGHAPDCQRQIALGITTKGDA